MTIRSDLEKIGKAALWRTLCVFGSVVGLAGCVRGHAPLPTPHLTVGPPYQVGDVWYYPVEQVRLTQTGLATVDTDTSSRLTADGEHYDPQALAAAHQTLQLPAIVRITNLENGRSLRLRVNDRGPASPSRLVSLTPRAAELLGIQKPTKIRLDVDEAASTQLLDHFRSPADGVKMQAAPRQDVAQESLAPPSGASGSAGIQSTPAPTIQNQAETSASDIGPLPEQVEQGVPSPGNLYIKAGVFGGMRAASIQASRLGAMGARVERARVNGQERNTVLMGPFATIAEADAALDRALAAGVPDARIVVATDSRQLID
ncbi:Lipoprotein [Granulibacter bethesdensis]|uniref:Endolytic peptidoglycan transglycosylase RlpA n=1 Tax=Granulibacter bethesdensis TaxID=364410 RepID=A0AAN0RDK7_9PROT|nr:SPOR domain-containing protein [Granulibacter bethesdensis]AHJ62885.1 Lipoprotein [Granulibacter bethesdensis]